MSIATPAVVTWNAHGLYDGATFRFTATSGALATGVALNTDYFVTAVDANSFRLSTTLANQVTGTFISTSGSQSGNHTGENYTVDRGVGAGTSELELLNGLWVNKNDITNGPLAHKGTFVGTIYANGSSQVDFKIGGIAAQGGEAIIGIWNTYSRVSVGGNVTSSAASWSWGGPVYRPLGGWATMRATMVSGLAEDVVDGYACTYYTFDSATSSSASIGWRGAVPGGLGSSCYNGSGWGCGLSSAMKSPLFLGLGFIQGLEYAFNYTSSYVNLIGGTQTGTTYGWRY